MDELERFIDDKNAKILNCCECNGQFDFSEKEQKFYADKGLVEPRRCKPCREANKVKREQRHAGQLEQRRQDEPKTNLGDIWWRSRRAT